MQALPILFLKTYGSERPIYQKTFTHEGRGEPAEISFRSFIPKDVFQIFHWVNQPYSARFWQMKGKSPYTLREQLTETMQDPSAHILIGCYNGKPVCEVDVYQVKGKTSELDRYLPRATSADCGLHFLMAPPKQTFKGLSTLMLRAFMDTYFGYPYSGDLYAEPDELNTLANRLALRSGFAFQKRINLPDKIASLYRITKTEFLARAPQTPL